MLTATFRAAVVAGLMFLACGVGGCAVGDSAVKTQAEATHQALAPAIEQDPTLNDYFQQLGRRIITSAQQLDGEHVGPSSHFKDDNSWMWSDNIQFHLVNSQTLNAFTTGGDHVYVYNELFQKCNSEDELAAVMSHEFAHIYCRHVQSGMRRQEVMAGGQAVLGTAANYAGGANGSTYAQAAANVANLVGMHYTRGDEDQADQYGFAFYCRAGWEPAQFANFFKTMITLGFDTTPTLLSDHPKLADRVTATNQRLADFTRQYPNDPYRKPEIATQDQFVRFRQMALEIAKRTPNDQQLAKAQQLLNAFPSCVAHTESPEQVKAKQELLKEVGADPDKVDAQQKQSAQ